MRWPARPGSGPTGRPPGDVAPGERVLAWCETVDGEVVAGTRDALHLPGVRLPWEEVWAADWDADAELLSVSEVGTWGQPRPVHALAIHEPGRLLELLRERVTASIVLQRQVRVHGRRGLRVVGRRAPHRGGAISWSYDFDEGIDPGDPAVERAMTSALASAREEVGET